MIKYFELHGEVYKSTINNKLYLYDNKLKDWKYIISIPKQYLLKWYDHNPLTLLDMVMLGIDKP